MDLRVKKTLINIKEAFFSLRKKKSVEKITVKELSETAMINKATFYLHFKDIYDLSDKMQEEVLDGIVAESMVGGLEKTRESYISFSRNLIYATEQFRSRIEILFSGMNNEFISRLSNKLKEKIFAAFPEFRYDVEKNIMISYIVYGSYNASISDFNCSDEEKIFHICRFSEKLWMG